MPQFHPELNPRNVLPKRQLRHRHRAASPNFTYDTRLIDKGEGWLSSVRSNLTYIRGAPLAQDRDVLRRHAQFGRQGRRRRRVWSGDFNFSVDTSNPLDTNFAYANALLGNINSYTETTASPTCAASARRRRPTSRTPGSQPAT